MGTADLVGYHIPSEPNPEERVLSLIPISRKYRMTLLLVQLHHEPSTCQGELDHTYVPQLESIRTRKNHSQEPKRYCLQNQSRKAEN